MQTYDLLSKGYKNGVYSYTLSSKGAITIQPAERVKALIKQGSILINGYTLSSNNSLVKHTSSFKIAAKTGNELRELAIENLRKYPKPRDFVSKLCNSLDLSQQYVNELIGLRGTGKTVGLLHAIAKLNKYAKTAYIVIDSSIDFSTLVNYITANRKNIEYFFIDEITMLKDFVDKSSKLYDLFTISGTRIVISGTESYALILANKDRLVHRNIPYYTTFVSYSECKRTCGVGSVKDYLTMGGLYIANQYKGIKGLQAYMDTNAIKNIDKTLARNTQLKGVACDINLLRAAIYHIIIRSVVHSAASSEYRALKVSELTNAMSNYTKANEAAYANTLMRLLNLRTNIKIEPSVMHTAFEILEDLGILSGILNVGEPEQVYYLTNQFLHNQLLYLLIQALGATSGTVSNLNGLMLEAIVVNHLLQLNIDDCSVCTYTKYNTERRAQEEVDVIVTRDSSINPFPYAHLFEVKKCSSVYYALLQAKSLMRVQFKGYNVLSYNIICDIDTDCILTAPSQILIPDSGSIEERNRLFNEFKGIRLISANNFLSNPESYLEFPTEYTD